MLEHVVEQTNRNALELCFLSTKQGSRSTRWKDLTVEKLKIFIGLFLLMGVCRITEKPVGCTTPPVLQRVMSRNRLF